MEKDKILEQFMREHFPYIPLKKEGFFTKDMRGNYESQAKKVCEYFGYKTIYEYGAKEIRCHISYKRPLFVDENGDLNTEPFITVIPSIYE